MKKLTCLLLLTILFSPSLFGQGRLYDYSEAIRKNTNDNSQRQAAREREKQESELRALQIQIQLLELERLRESGQPAAVVTAPSVPALNPLSSNSQLNSRPENPAGDLSFNFTDSSPVIGILSNNPFAGFVNPYSINSVSNPYGPYGSPYSNTSANNPYGTNAPLLFDQQGHYRGRLSSNPYESDSITNRYGVFGSPFSPTSINNPYGAGNPYLTDSPLNPYGKGWLVVAP